MTLLSAKKGKVVTLFADWKDRNGAPFVATDQVLTITLPDRTVVTVQRAAMRLGVDDAAVADNHDEYDYETSDAGDHHYEWACGQPIKDETSGVFAVIEDEL